MLLHNKYPYSCSSRNMPRVDAKGRVVLPKDVRKRLGITPGTEVEVREENGMVVIVPEDDPEQIIQRMESLIKEATADRDPYEYGELNLEAKKHADIIRRETETAEQSPE